MIQIPTNVRESGETNFITRPGLYQVQDYETERNLLKIKFENKNFHRCVHRDRTGTTGPASVATPLKLRRAAVSSQLKTRVDNILGKTTGLRITLNIDGTPTVSRSHTHPSDSSTSRLLTSSLSLGVPVRRVTQCMRVVQIPHLQFLVFHHNDTHLKVLSVPLALSIHNKRKVYSTPIY